MLQLDFIVSRNCDVTCKDATQSAPFACKDATQSAPFARAVKQKSPSKKKVERAQRITSLEGYMARNLHACRMLLVR